VSAAILTFPRALPVVAPKPVEPYRQLPQWSRDEAERRRALIAPALDRITAGCSVLAAVTWLVSAPGWNGPSVRTMKRWVADYQNGGIIGLAPEYKGRTRPERGWEARAIELFNAPQRRSYSTVALLLRQEGYTDAADHLVRAYLKAQPSNLTETGQKRLGSHFYDQNIRPYIVRDTSTLPIGFVYQGDGHCCDVYVAAPATGNPFRPELTVWIDVRSHYVVGWWLSESESAITTLYSFSHALLANDHVPAMVHTDPGSGFTARVISDSENGFFSRFDIEMITALPGNAKGKGLVEGWFRWFEERLGKQFETFCGHCRTDDALRALTQKVRAGKLALPSLAEYRAAIAEYVRFYNHNPQRNLGDTSPAELWLKLDRVPLETPAAAIMRPRRTRTVRRWGVTLDERKYRAHALAGFEGREVVVEYDLHDDTYVVILDGDGRFVCEAQLVDKQAWIPQSRIDQAQQKRLAGQRKRLQVKIAEAEARAHVPISPAQVLAALEDSAEPAEPLPAAAILALGHSVGDVRTPRSLPTPKPIDPAEMARVQAVIADDAASAPQETENQRYARALRLMKQAKSGVTISSAELRWLSTYTDSAEYLGLADIHASFGYVPGLENDEGPAGTEPSLHRDNFGE